MAKTTGAGGRAMAAVPTGTGRMTKEQATRELNILNNYKLDTVRGYATTRNLDSAGMGANYVVEQRADGFHARVILTLAGRNVANLSAEAVLGFLKARSPGRLEGAIRRIARNRGVPIGTISPAKAAGG